MSDSPQPPHRITLTHSQFLVAAALLEGGLLVAAFALGWIVGHNPTATLFWNLNRIREFMRDTIGPFLARCRLIDLVLLAMLAGMCEEILFRGLVFQFLSEFDRGMAIIVSNLLFALAHVVTPLYAFLAAMAGLYLTALLVVDPSPNLLLPIVAHAAYDFIAFLVVVRDFKRHRRPS